jgi:hypothetical protein
LLYQWEGTAALLSVGLSSLYVHNVHQACLLARPGPVASLGVSKASMHSATIDHMDLEVM